MKATTNKKKVIRFLSIALSIIAVCYLSPVVVNYAISIWYEDLFWEECVKQDEQIPPNTELLISACTDPEVRGVPGGEVLFVHEKKTGEMYLLDLQTGEKRPVPNDPLLLREGIFLSSELVWFEDVLSPDINGYKPHYILDLTNGQKYELVDLRMKFSDRVVNNSEFIPEVIPYFTEEEQVFVHYGYYQLIVLSPNFRQQPERNVMFPLSLISDGKTGAEYVKLIERLMGDLKIKYEIIDLSLKYGVVPSPNGKYIASTDGIFISGLDTPIVSAEYTTRYYAGKGGSFISWYYDDSGFVFTQGRYYYFQDNFVQSHFPLPRPILKFNLPVQ